MLYQEELNKRDEYLPSEPLLEGPNFPTHGNQGAEPRQEVGGAIHLENMQ